MGIVGSSCCYVIEQMDRSVSGLVEVFSPHHAMVGRECAKKTQNNKCLTNPDYYNKSNNIEGRALVIVI